MIRRALGSTPPASPTAGDAVTDAAAPQTSFTDTALASGTPYAYAIFAHNGTPIYATAATITVVTTASESGNVSGTVIDAGGAHHGLANVEVLLTTLSHVTTYATTDASGRYTVTGLDAGTYSVCFSGYSASGGFTDTLGYLDQCYNGQSTSSIPTPVSVTAGQTTTGIDAAMVEKGAISGMVTDAAGSQSAVSRFVVTATSPTAGAIGNAIVSPDGSYTTTGVPPAADYRVCFQSSGQTRFVDQCYDNQATSAAATPVAVTSGITTPRINAALTAWGTISGTVTDAGGTHQGLANVSVMISSRSTGAMGGGTTAADGTYSSNTLPAATDYQVCFFVNGATGGPGDAAGYVNQCYNNQSVTAAPTPVTVTPGVSTTISAALVRGGAVSGAVTDAGGSPHGLAHVSVEVSSASTGDHAWAATAADGSYTVKGLDAATDYQVCFHGSVATGGSSDTAGYVDQCWQNQPTSGTPTPITLTSGATTTGINAALVGAG
jgi:Carboxypeptidase regulatory-like domain